MQRQQTIDWISTNILTTQRSAGQPWCGTSIAQHESSKVIKLMDWKHENNAWKIGEHEQHGNQHGWQSAAFVETCWNQPMNSKLSDGLTLAPQLQNLIPTLLKRKLMIYCQKWTDSHSQVTSHESWLQCTEWISPRIWRVRSRGVIGSGIALGSKIRRASSNML